MTIEDGELVSDTVEDILNAMLEEARAQFGDDINDGELSVIRAFYIPVAEQLAKAQEDVGLVLSSAQIDNAEGAALDLLTALIGVRREDSRRATGEVIFSRENAATTDFSIPRGTIVQTDNRLDPIRFKTTTSAVLSAGETEVSVPVEADSGGVVANMGSNALVIMPKPPSGIETVTNPEPTDGGTERETDSELRDRAKKELADGAKATAAALVAGARAVDGVASVNIFINDSNVDETDTGGLPDHSFELVIEGGDPDEIGQMLLETKAAGDTAYAGAFGIPETATGVLINGQEFEVDFSRPSPVHIYVDVSMKVTEEYAGDDDVRDAVVTYIGGLLSTGNMAGGKLGVGDEVLYGKVEFAIRGVRGVYDVSDLKVDVVSPPVGTSNISIEPNEMATSDASDGSIEINTTEV